MSQTMDAQVGIIQELRLRRWARRNWVSADLRRATWHPIVLDEMLLRDEELAEQAISAEHQPVGSRFVPLAFTEFDRLHAAHESAPDPHFSRVGRPVDARQEAGSVYF